MHEFIHKRCLHKVTFQKDLVTAGYFAACLNCDEDLYRFETMRVAIPTTKLIVTMLSIQTLTVVVFLWAMFYFKVW